MRFLNASYKPIYKQYRAFLFVRGYFIVFYLKSLIYVKKAIYQPK